MFPVTIPPCTLHTAQLESSNSYFAFWENLCFRVGLLPEFSELLQHDRACENKTFHLFHVLGSSSLTVRFQLFQGWASP
ncbi:hypothetical protein CEXT_510211 [Caerostris extrusa]|uniref:Uncharacterized protein n=1 Tax=Caerostris extrusa TaxID=172846 RepID=A0AAV4QXE7_CAEEX|nr:hypothetical protein CEXT_510211 [Caerostris extrusa]